MSLTLNAFRLTLHEVKSKFKLQYTEKEDFFPEWMDLLNLTASLTTKEKDELDQVKHQYLYLSEFSMLEVVVKMLVLSPLLRLAGFYDPPFLIKAEESVEILVQEAQELIKGQIDILVVQERLWVAVIESKRAKFNIMEALPQTLTYMVASPNQVVFGLMTSGDHSIFVKLDQRTKQYSLSDSFFLFDRGNALYSVLAILKRLGNTFNHV